MLSDIFDTFTEPCVTLESFAATHPQAEPLPLDTMIAPTCALSESNFNRIRVVFMKKLFAFFRLPLPKESRYALVKMAVHPRSSVIESLRVDSIFTATWLLSHTSIAMKTSLFTTEENCRT